MAKTRVGDDENLSKRWQNVENYVAQKKSKKARRIAQKIAETLKKREQEPTESEILILEERVDEDMGSLGDTKSVGGEHSQSTDSLDSKKVDEVLNMDILSRTNSKGEILHTAEKTFEKTFEKTAEK